MDTVDEGERTLIIIVLMVITIIFVSVVLTYSNNQKINQLTQYSSSEWSVTQVKSKSVTANNDGSLTYVLHVINHDKAPLDSFIVDKELYDQVEQDDLVRYNFDNNLVAEKFEGVN